MRVPEIALLYNDAERWEMLNNCWRNTPSPLSGMLFSWQKKLIAP